MQQSTQQLIPLRKDAAYAHAFCAALAAFVMRRHFLACLQSVGFDIHQRPNSKIVVAQRGTEVISNSDGLGYIDEQTFHRWR
jgi:hypothetical protein